MRLRFPEIRYMTWAKSRPLAPVDLARSGIDYCPRALLGLSGRELAIQFPVGHGYPPLLSAIARRYRVSSRQVFTVPGGASLANWLALATALDGAPPSAEVVVERPTYEPLHAIPRGFGARVRRLDRRFQEGFRVDLGRFESLVGPRTRLAVVTNLHNPSGARIETATLVEMARILDRVGAHLLVDEVYLECLFGRGTESCVHAGSNVITTNSLTKAYGLDGLRAGWILGPEPFLRRAARIYDAMGVNGVAPGEHAALAAFRNLGPIAARAHAILGPNLAAVRRYFATERRLQVVEPPGGNVCFPRLPRGLEAMDFWAHLLRRYGTLVVPGQFFEAPRHFRFSFGCAPGKLARGLRNVSRALSDLGARG